MYAFGEAMGREQFLKVRGAGRPLSKSAAPILRALTPLPFQGSNVMLGPGVNLARVPWCGRNVRHVAGV